MGHDHDHGHSHSNSGHSHEHDSHGHSYQNAHDDNNHSHGHSHAHGANEDAGHNHGHSHIDGDGQGKKKRTASDEEHDDNQRRLKHAMIFVSVFMVIEVIGGVMAHSIAIMTDAAHLLTDISSFVMAIIAAKLARTPATKHLSYGLVRAEVLSALASTLLIWLLTGALVWEAIGRICDWFLGTAEPVDGKLMTGVAVMGLAVNIVLLAILGFGHGHGEGEGGEGEGGDHGHSHEHGHGHSHFAAAAAAPKKKKKPSAKVAQRRGGGGADGGGGGYGALEEGGPAGEEEEGGEGGRAGGAPTNKPRNVNVAAAYLHAITDLLQNLGVILAGVVIWCKPDWQIADPLCTVLFAVLVVVSTVAMIRGTVLVLLEAVPYGVDYEEVRRALEGVEGVTDVHDLHIWSLTVGRNAATAHMKARDPKRALGEAHRAASRLGLSHVTFQIQPDDCLPEDCDHPCPSAAGMNDDACCS